MPIPILSPDPAIFVTEKYTINDEFNDSRSVGEINGTLANGSGTRAQRIRKVTDTTSKLSIASGILSDAGGKPAPAFGDPGLWYGAFTRASGLSVAAQINIVTAGFQELGWDSAQSGAILDSIYPGSSMYFAAVPDGNLIATAGGSRVLTVNTPYVAQVVLRSVGAQYFCQGGDYTRWRRLWVSNVGSGATVYPGISNYSTVSTHQYIHVNQLGAPFITDSGAVTQDIVGVVPEGQEFSHTADAILYFDNVTLPAAGAIRVAIRRVDDDNCMVISIDSTGAMSIFSRIGGVDQAALSINAGAVANGNRVANYWDGVCWKNYANYGAKNSTDLALQFQGYTSGKVLSLGTGGVIIGLNTWPCWPTGAERDQLDFLVPKPTGIVVTYGDSVTVGNNASDVAHRWANIVAAARGLNLVNSGIGATRLQNTIQTTEATINWASNNNGHDTYYNRVARHQPNMVLILYGLCDILFNDAAYSVANFQNDLGELIDGLTASGIPVSNIVIGSPSYTNGYAFAAPNDAGSTLKHLAYVAVCAAVAAAKGTKYIDVYQWMIDNGGNSLLSVDKLHPNDAGHAAIANAFLSVI